MAHVGAFVGRTIDAHLARAFIVVAVADRIRTGDVEKNMTLGTFLCHTRLQRRSGQRLCAERNGFDASYSIRVSIYKPVLIFKKIKHICTI